MIEKVAESVENGASSSSAGISSWSANETGWFMTAIDGGIVTAPQIDL